MRLVLLVAIAGCYREPDYSGTQFRCDDAHSCPPGQSCVAGMCSDSDGGSGGGGDGVVCGTQTCTANQQCCVDFVNSPRCVTSGCTGIVATCDGREDCDGQLCCRVGTASACQASCASEALCRDPSDCPTTAPMCCFNTIVGEPWGLCLSVCP